MNNSKIGSDKIQSLSHLKESIYNPKAAKMVRELATKNDVTRKPFDPESFQAFIKDHPLLTKLHLISED